MQQREGKAAWRLFENIILIISTLLFLAGTIIDTVFTIFAVIREYNEAMLRTMKNINFQAKAVNILEEAKENIG